MGSGQRCCSRGANRGHSTGGTRRFDGERSQRLHSGYARFCSDCRLHRCACFRRTVAGAELYIRHCPDSVCDRIAERRVCRCTGGG